MEGLKREAFCTKCGIVCTCVLIGVWLFVIPWAVTFPSVYRFILSRILEWVAISSSGGSSHPRDGTHVSWGFSIDRQIIYHWVTDKATGVDWGIFRYSEVRMYKIWWIFRDNNTTGGLWICIGDFILLRKNVNFEGRI